MNAQVQELLREQVNRELFSAYFYLAIASHYHARKLDGFGRFFEMQAEEEKNHAMKFLKYLLDNDVKMNFGPIDAPSAHFADEREPLAAALRHEQYITSLIHSLYKQARDGDDFRTCQFLEWFIGEQGEEEKSAGDLIARFDLCGGDARGLYLLNAELKSRA